MDGKMPKIRKYCQNEIFFQKTELAILTSENFETIHILYKLQAWKTAFQNVCQTSHCHKYIGLQLSKNPKIP